MFLPEACQLSRVSCRQVDVFRRAIGARQGVTVAETSTMDLPLQVFLRSSQIVKGMPAVQ